jgi:hypothetical protein
LSVHPIFLTERESFHECADASDGCRCAGSIGADAHGLQRWWRRWGGLRIVRFRILGLGIIWLRLLRLRVIRLRFRFVGLGIIRDDLQW